MKLSQKQKRTKNNVSQPFSPPIGGEKSSSLLCLQSKEGTEMFILLFLLIGIYSLSEFCLIILFLLFLLLIIYEKMTYMEISSVSPVSWGKMVISRFLFLSPWIVFTCIFLQVPVIFMIYRRKRYLVVFGFHMVYSTIPLIYHSFQEQTYMEILFCS